MGKRIFIVDEDTATIDHLSKAMSSAGYEIVSARNGKEALEDLNINNVPHLIITNSDLPEISGLELCKEVRRDNRLKNIPIVVTYRKDIYEKPYRDIRIEEFVRKPVNAMDLLKTAEILMAYGSRANIPVKSRYNTQLIAIILVVVAMIFLSIIMIGVNNIPFLKGSS